jgi:hypothetical protein
MSNVEKLRAFLEAWGEQPWTPEAWERGDVIDMSFFDPDVVYEDAILPDHGDEAYHGQEGIVRAAKRWIEGSEWLRVELEQISGEGDPSSRSNGRNRRPGTPGSNSRCASPMTGRSATAGSSISSRSSPRGRPSPEAEGPAIRFAYALREPPTDR